MYHKTLNIWTGAFSLEVLRTLLYTLIWLNNHPILKDGLRGHHASTYHDHTSFSSLTYANHLNVFHLFVLNLLDLINSKSLCLVFIFCQIHLFGRYSLVFQLKTETLRSFQGNSTIGLDHLSIRRFYT